ncbi:MAG: STAS domain-containing protein [Thermoleophilaceae bacterium]
MWPRRYRGGARSGLAHLLEPATVHTQNENQAPVVVVTGEIDMATAPMLERELSAAIETAAGAVVLDLVDVSFFDSSGLRVAIVAHRDLKEQGRRLAVVCDPQGHVRRTFGLAGLADLLDLHPSRAAALAELDR